MSPQVGLRSPLSCRQRSAPRRGVHQTQLQAKPPDPSQPRPRGREPVACDRCPLGHLAGRSVRGSSSHFQPGRKTVPELTQAPSARPHRVQGSGRVALAGPTLPDSENCSLLALLPPRLAPMATTASRWQGPGPRGEEGQGRGPEGPVEIALPSPPTLPPSWLPGPCAPAVDGQVKSPQGDPTSCPPARPAVAGAGGGSLWRLPPLL